MKRSIKICTWDKANKLHPETCPPCKDGDKCRFLHQPVPVKKYYLQNEVKLVEKLGLTGCKCTSGDDSKNPKCPLHGTVCKFESQGNCKYGDSCKYLHPAKNDEKNALDANKLIQIYNPYAASVKRSLTE